MTKFLLRARKFTWYPSILFKSMQVKNMRHESGRLNGLFVIAALLVGLIGVALASAGHGAVAISAQQVIAVILNNLGISSSVDYPAQFDTVIMEIRLPRVLLAMLVGAALAISGTAMQGLFRNPLADPALIGVSSGAAFFAAAVMVSGFTLGSGLFAAFSLPLAAFTGGLLTTLLIYFMATHQGQTQVTAMLLAGIAINALAGAGTGLLSYIADDATLRSITFWTMGSLGGANWQQLSIVGPLVLISLILLPWFSNALNTLLLGEAEAGHLGYDIQKVKRNIIILVALAVGCAVSVSGVIGFVGLVVPHLLRLLIGPDHRYLMPASLLLGALLLLLADLIARLIVAPAEVPIGIVTAAIGAPFFLWLLWKQRSRFAL